MTAQIPSLTPRQSTELTALLRGVERRAAVFAELACGDPSRGDDALGAAMRALRNAVARGSQAPADTLFWSLLVAAPQLRRPADAGHWPASLAGLAALGLGARVALLLRLVAGLDDDAAAAALRVAPATFARAMQRAIALPAGASRAAFWEDIARAVEQRIQHVPPARLVQLAAMRERAADARPPAAAPVVGQRRWAMPAAGAALGLCALAFAATFIRHAPSSGPRIELAALPAAASPVDTFDAETAVLTHRDFEQLADTRDAAVVRDLDFYAWYAAQLAASSRSATPILLPDAAQPLPATPTGATHAPH